MLKLHTNVTIENCSVLEKFEIVKAVKKNFNLINAQTETDLATNQLYEMVC